MEIVDFETFVRLPAGTIFAPYKPCVLEEPLVIKVDKGCDLYTPTGEDMHVFNGVMSLEPWIDGLYCSLFELGDHESASFKIYDGDNNDYKEYKMFLILEKEDVKRLIKVLQWANRGCVGNNPGEIELEES